MKSRNSTHLLSALALSLVAFGAHASTIITINPDGAGPDAAISVGSLGWNNGNAISTPVGTGSNIAVLGTNPTTGQPITGPSGTLQVYGQGALANFNNSLGNTIGGTGLNSTYQWTYVFGYQETATSTITGSGVTANFKAVSGGNNFFQIWYNPGLTSNNLNGTGFNQDTLILSGIIMPFNGSTGSGAGTYSTSGVTGPLDAFGTNNYPTVNTNNGTGSSDFVAAIDILTLNKTFFPTLSAGTIITTDTFNNLPFNQTDPSSCFWNGSAQFGGAGQNSTGTAPSGCTNTVGSTNGISGPNVMFETRATTNFASALPEPGSLSLAGIALLGLAGAARRRSN